MATKRTTAKNVKAPAKEEPAAKAKPAAETEPPPAKDGNYRVRIRMYRHGLGDSFLLSFPQGEGRHTHLLIDCGIVLGTSKPGEVMTLVAQDILAETGGKIDILVITHEHWDHLSAFDEKQARAIFRNIDIERLWLAWTEGDDDLAHSLRDERERKKEAAQAAKAEAKKRGLDDVTKRMAGVLGFFGAAAAGEDGSEDADSGEGTAGALKFLKGKCTPTIMETGKSYPMPTVDGIQVYVMGPPHDGDAMKKTNPYQGEGYGFGEAAIGLTDAFLAAFDPADERAQPFNYRLRRPLPDPQAATPAPPPAALQALGYYDPEFSWRTIDNAWLATGERLALQLDSATNNTSLVLAIELDGEDVLLFVGDAQAGNWRSWEGKEWKVRDKDGKDRTVTAEDLLRRTIFYKVGHHGSHNATLRAKGLELMTSDRLAAVIPVDTDVAHNVKRWTHMPLPEIQDRLKEKCAVLFQSDQDPIEIKKVPGTRWEHSAKKFKVYSTDKKTKMETTKDRLLYTDYFV